MKKILALALLGLLITACNKDQKTVKQLDGKWNATSYTVTSDGTSENFVTSGFGLSITFENCKLKDDEFCRATWVESYPGDDIYTEIFDYRVAGQGTSLEIREPSYPAELIYFKIVSFEKDLLKLELNFGDGDITEIEMKRE